MTRAEVGAGEREGGQEWPGDRRNTITDENKTASLQAIYFKIARIAAETNPIETAAESGHSTSSNVVRLKEDQGFNVLANRKPTLKFRSSEECQRRKAARRS